MASFSSCSFVLFLRSPARHDVPADGLSRAGLHGAPGSREEESPRAIRPPRPVCGSCPHAARKVSRGCVFQIDSYEKLYEEVSKFESVKVFGGWLQCDCRPFKQGLLNTIKRWSFMFKRHLSNHVLSRWAPPPPRLEDRTLGARAARLASPEVHGVSGAHAPG